MSERFDVLACPLAGINLVEASAGTGKTWNICGLYLRLLLERGLEPRQILVVTFTNAATAELRERVRSRIVDMLGHVGGRSWGEADAFVRDLTAALEMRGLSRADLHRRLDLALQSFDEAAILTIHGFCQRALAETPFAAGRPFALDVQPDDSALRLAVVHDFWRRHIAGGGCPAALAAWIDAKRTTPAKLSELLARHLARPLARVRWPDAIDEPLDLDVEGLEALFARARATWNASRADIACVLDDALPGLRSHAQSAVPHALEDWAAWLARDALEPIDWRKSRLEQLGASCLAKNTKKNQAVPKHAFFEEADALLTARRSAEAKLERARLRLIRRLFDEAPAALDQRKREARLASYDDLLHNLHHALKGERGRTLAAELHQRFPAALIDEFQDTDPLQFGIFQAIYGSGEAPLFLVGDPKQAIYGFRNADLHTYLRAARAVKAAWTLADNQRSTPGLVQAINALFDANPRAFMLDGLAYHDVDVGRKEREVLRDASGACADLTIWMLPRWDGGSPLDRRSALTAAASATAAEVARLLRASEAGEIALDSASTGKNRALAPHDIAVLVRSHRQGDEIKQALAALGVASVELSQATVFKSADAEEVQRVLAAVLEPGDDGLVRAALATELIGLDAATLAALEADESALMTYVQRFADYRQTWQDAGVGFMYREMLAKEGVAARMLARRDGERRLTNLVHLGELLHAAAQERRSPDALLRWLDSQRRDDARDEAAQLRLESDRNLVRIVTIHKVKGLEYPVVFCPFLFDAFQLPARNGDRGREYHDDDGVAVIDLRGDDALGAELEAIKARVKLERCAEDVRLIYVALTRASHRCYLVAGCYGRRNSGAKLSPRESAAGLLNWLVAGAGVAPDVWLRDGGAPVAIDDAWLRLGCAVGPHVACTPLPMQRGEPVSPAAAPVEALVALKAPRHIADPWRISSFSGLHHGAVGDGAASDHDAGGDGDVAPAPDTIAGGRTASPRDVAPDDILRFPRGVGAGDCLHAVLERIDFTNPRGWDEAIGRALQRHPVSLPTMPASAQQPILQRMMSRMIHDLVRTELPDGLRPRGIRLDAIGPERRLAELEFSLPARQLDATALNAALKSLGYPVDRLTFGRLDGYLRGFIDLVFEHAGRYYLIDWKSNHLGHSPADYEPAALAVAMAQHGYHLQSLLYSLALTRYLRRRVRDYRHEHHFGGVLYLFLRGVRPGWKCADGTATGVHFHRPEAATLARLEALFDRPAVEATR